MTIPERAGPKQTGSASLNLRVPQALADALDAQAGSEGRSAFIRRLIATAVAEGGGAGGGRALPVQGDRRRLQISLSETELGVLDYRAGQRSVTRSAWVKILVRRHLGLKGKVDDGLIAAFAPIHSQLLRIGRNINQAARVANAAQRDGTVRDIEKAMADIAKMRMTLSEQLGAIRAAIMCDVDYWHVPD